MEQALFVKFLENMIALCQSTLAEMSQSEKEPVVTTPVRRKTFDIKTHDTPMMNGKKSWFAWRSVQDGRGTRIFTKIYDSEIKGISELRGFGWWATVMLSAYKIHVGGHGARSTFDMDAFRADYDSGYVHVLTSDESLPLERPLGKRASLMDMVEEPASYGCMPVEAKDSQMRLQSIAEQLLAGALRNGELGRNQYEKLARELSVKSEEIEPAFEYLVASGLMRRSKTLECSRVYSVLD
jgi:hypothetical protein